MNASDGNLSPRAIAGSRWMVAAAAVVVFALAYGSPVETVDADPALALVASQALVDHKSLRIDPYRGDERLAYDLETDYRVRRYEGAYYANSVGVPILSAPAVWVANRFGLDMLDQDDEFALQNLLSAITTVVLFLLFVRLGGLFLSPEGSVMVATISTLGTSVMSTGGTGLWNSNYSLIFVTVALIYVAERADQPLGIANVGTLGALLFAGFFCRPSTAFFGIALLMYLRQEEDRRVKLVAWAGLGVAAVALILPRWVPLPWMAAHYSPARLRFTSPFGTGIYGVLASPSRGIFVFSPFLALIAVASIGLGGRLSRDRLFRMLILWIALLTLAVATNEGKWWGGHAFGPRMLIDIVPAFVMLTGIVGRYVREHAAPPRRLALTVAYVALGVLGIAVHAQALFNPATRAWNLQPNIDADPSLAMDWRYPQFLATRAGLEERIDRYERRTLAAQHGELLPYSPGVALLPGSRRAIFLSWYPPEIDWRWTRGERAEILLALPAIDTDQLYVLHVFAGSMGAQRVDVEVNGAPIASLAFADFEPSWRLAMVPPQVLLGNDINTVAFDVEEPRSSAIDPRRLGLALRELRLTASDIGRASFTEDAYFVSGFSTAESDWRWTDGTSAEMLIPVGPVEPDQTYELTVNAHPLGSQRVELWVNGTSIGSIVAEPTGTGSHSVRFAAELLRADDFNQLVLRLPGATSPAGDSRLLGLAIESVVVAAAESTR